MRYFVAILSPVQIQVFCFPETLVLPSSHNHAQNSEGFLPMLKVAIYAQYQPRIKTRSHCKLSGAGEYAKSGSWKVTNAFHEIGSGATIGPKGQLMGLAENERSIWCSFGNWTAGADRLRML